MMAVGGETLLNLVEPMQSAAIRPRPQHAGSVLKQRRHGQMRQPMRLVIRRDGIAVVFLQAIRCSDPDKAGFILNHDLRSGIEKPLRIETPDGQRLLSRLRKQADAGDDHRQQSPSLRSFHTPI